MWNIHNGCIIGRLEGHLSQITKVTLYAEKIVISSSADGTIKFWDLNIK